MRILTGKEKIGQARRKTCETEIITGKKDKINYCNATIKFFKAVFLYPPEIVRVNSLHNAPDFKITHRRPPG
jgi:hypothetical protein